MKNRESDVRIINMSEENAEKRKNRATFSITSSMIAKVTAFLLAILFTFTLAVCVIGAALMVELELYTTPESVFLNEAFISMARKDCDYLMSCLSEYGIVETVQSNDREKQAKLYCDDTSIAAVKFTNRDDNKVLWEYTSEESVSDNSPTELTFAWYDYYYTEDSGNYVEHVGAVVDVEMTISTESGVKDKYYIVEWALDTAYSMLYSVYVLGVCAFAGMIICVVFLVCSAGHRKGLDVVVSGWGTKVPFDLLTLFVGAVAVSGVLLSWFVLEGLQYEERRILIWIALLVLIYALIEAVALGWLMSFAVRIKLGRWWRNTVIFYFLRFVWRAARRIVSFVRRMPLVWKTVLSVTGVTLIEAAIIVATRWEFTNLISFWIIEKLVLVPIVLNSVLTMRKLKDAGKALSEGDLSYQVDTAKMWGDFKHHGEALNSIAEGMSVAVEERMKSERMKTELITNVSHDIKTPLTSIISYSDLISKEKCDNHKITEYAQVLLRSSERLKRLIEDLVEASKASTGNLEMVLEPCNLNILLTQAVGEYGDRLKDSKLELVSLLPQHEVTIVADGRRLWRVLDNLVNNVCKYSQDFTRVYLSLEVSEGDAVIVLKNTSRNALNISADELMERFVRGDGSRSTEGNGLGLSIARSLTELQGGVMAIDIDGDLFKVTLRFPLYG